MSTEESGAEQRPVELQELAQRFGLSKLTPEQLEEFAQAEAYISRYAVRFPRELTLTDEPAFVFVPGSEVRP